MAGVSVSGPDQQRRLESDRVQGPERVGKREIFPAGGMKQCSGEQCGKGGDSR